MKDCVAAICIAIEKADAKVNVLNLGLDEYCEVKDSIGWISERLGVSPEIRYGGGERGWVGDSPFIFLDGSRIRKLGWVPQLSIRQGVVRTVEFLQDNEWVLDRY